MLIDSHAHLDFDSFPKSELAGVLTRARDAGVTKIIHIGSGEGLASYRNAIELCNSLENIYCTLGIHPHDADKCNDAALKEIAELAHNPKVVAIGEVGLDFHYNNSQPEIQKNVLISFTDLARKLGKPLAIHLREAKEDFLKIFFEQKMSEIGGVIHCFSEDYDFGKIMVENNFYVSFSGIVTFKKATAIADAASRLPLDKILIETDSPYLAPMPYRGKANEPAYVKHVAEKIAQLRGISFEEVAAATSTNAHNLFKLL